MNRAMVDRARYKTAGIGRIIRIVFDDNSLCQDFVDFPVRYSALEHLPQSMDAVYQASEFRILFRLHAFFSNLTVLCFLIDCRNYLHCGSDAGTFRLA